MRCTWSLFSGTPTGHGINVCPYKHSMLTFLISNCSVDLDLQFSPYCSRPPTPGQICRHRELPYETGRVACRYAVYSELCLETTSWPNVRDNAWYANHPYWKQ
jgi:hypothetical protein